MGLSDAQFAFMAILLLVIIITGCAMLYLLLRNTRFSGGSTGGASGDLTNMMILFQSMRETVEQQKELAKQFNHSIDRKVAEVREAMGSSANLKEQVAAAQAQIDTLVKDTKEQLASLNRRMEYLLDKAPGTEVPVMDVPDVEGAAEVAKEAIEAEVVKIESSDDVPEQILESEIEPTPAPEVTDLRSSYDGSAKLPPLHAIASSAPKKHDFIDNWAGVDFGVKDLPEPARLPEPNEPEDPESSRDAFRTLLNLKQTETHADFTNAVEASPSDESMSPVQRRIYEFSDAGMRVPEIARELGVGKGEVKLILNMRDSQA